MSSRAGSSTSPAVGILLCALASWHPGVERGQRFNAKAQRRRDATRPTASFAMWNETKSNGSGTTTDDEMAPERTMQRALAFRLTSITVWTHPCDPWNPRSQSGAITDHGLHGLHGWDRWEGGSGGQTQANRSVEAMGARSRPGGLIPRRRAVGCSHPERYNEKPQMHADGRR